MSKDDSEKEKKVISSMLVDVKTGKIIHVTYSMPIDFRNCKNAEDISKRLSKFLDALIKEGFAKAHKKRGNSKWQCG